LCIQGRYVIISLDSLFVPDIRRSCIALVDNSDILGCDAASIVNVYRRFGSVATTVSSVGPRRVSGSLVVFKTR